MSELENAPTDSAAPGEPAAPADLAPADAPMPDADNAAPDPDKPARDDDSEAILALRSLSAKAWGRLCRRIPLRTFMMELEKIDRAVYFRNFKGYRPQKIDAQHLDRVLRKEVFERGNGLLAQLVIYNWDEAEWKLYGALQKEVKKINEDVEAIATISDEQGDAIMTALEAEFDRRDVHIATVINGVRVSKEYLARRFADV